MASSSSSIGLQLENQVIRKLNDGIRLLHEPEQPDIDIIFFHGLQFEQNEYVHLTTWTCKNDPVKIWPKYWLPDSRVLLASYDSSIRKTPREGRMDLSTIAETLLTEILLAIQDVLDGGTRRPIILVGHSFGGLVIKKLCLLADKNVHGSRQRDLRKEFLKSLGGIYFLGTPHLGMEELSKIKEHVLYRSPLWPYMEQLSTHAARQNAKFDALWKQERFRHWQIFAVGEALETTIPSQSSVKKMATGAFRHILVPEASARIGQNFITVAENHFSLCMPDADNSTVFQHLLALILLVKAGMKARDRTRIRAPVLVTKIPAGVDHVLNTIYAKIEEKNRFIGFSGMGGVGKTTLAKLAFNKINPEFQYASFVEEVKSIGGGKNALQKEAWDSMLPRLEGEYAKSRWDEVRGKRFLLVFDGIDTTEQMEALEEIAEGNAAETSCFMVTTRNAELLKMMNDGGRTFVHHVEHLGFDDANKLFLTQAFPSNMHEPPRHLKKVIREIVVGCGGLPLTIEVIGRYLKETQDRRKWEEVLSELHAIDKKPAGVLEERVWSKLKLSYDSLKPEVQEMFLDCATIFRSEWEGAVTGHEIQEFSYGEVMSAWSSVHGSGRVGWQTLVDRSLVYDNEQNENFEFASFQPRMHEHLLTLGRRIARESGRLMATKTSQSGTTMSGYAHQGVSSLEKVVAYVIEPSWDLVEDKRGCCDMWEKWKPISQLQGLRYLVVRQEISGCNRCQRERFQLPRNLVMLHLHMAEYAVLIPSTFEKLVVLHVQGSLANSFEEADPESMRTHLSIATQREDVHVEGRTKRGPQRGKGYSNANRSQSTNLFGRCFGFFSHRLNIEKRREEKPEHQPNTRLQILSKLTSLHLQDCPQAQALIDTIGQLQELQYLQIESCDKLLTLPQTLGQLERLELVHIFNCKALHALPGTIGQLQELRYLQIESCDELLTLPQTLGQLGRLELLRICDCKELHALPGTLSQLHGLQELIIARCPQLQAVSNSLEWMAKLEHLRTVRINECSDVQKFQLEVHGLKGCSLFVSSAYEVQVLPSTLGQLHQLQALEICECPNLLALPDVLGQLRQLRIFEIRECPKLQALPDTLGHLQQLQTLWISECPHLQALPDTLGHLHQLHTLWIRNCPNLHVLPDALGQLQQLHTLKILTCLNLLNLPDTLGQLRRLRTLKILACSNLRALPDTLGQLQQLHTLKILACSNLEALPNTLGQLKQLQKLLILECPNLQALPDTLGQLQQLHTVWIGECLNLQTLPDTLGQLQQLQTLKILTCPNLQTLPDTLGQLQQLDTLKILMCPNLHVVPDTLGQLLQLSALKINTCPHLQALPDTLGHLKQLQTLKISTCSILEALPDTLGQLQRLQKLLILDCSKLQALPDTLGHLQQLHTLWIGECPKLQALPETLGQLQQLQMLGIRECSNLQTLPDTLGQLQQLRIFEIRECWKLQSLPETLGQLQQLQMLWISECPNLQVLPYTLGQLEQLQTLEIITCLKLQCLPDTLGHLHQLQTLEIFTCPKLQALPDTLGQLHQLQKFRIHECPSLQTLPDTLGQLEQLQTFEIHDCPNLQALPDTLGQLQQLQKLWIRECPNLQALPVTLGQPQQLQKLWIRDCPNLQARPETLC